MEEGLMNTKDVGHSCVQFLENKNLFQVQSTENVIAVHDVVRNMEKVPRTPHRSRGGIGDSGHANESP